MPQKRKRPTDEDENSASDDEVPEPGPADFEEAGDGGESSGEEDTRVGKKGAKKAKKGGFAVFGGSIVSN